MDTDSQRTLYCRAELNPENNLQLSGIAVRYGDTARLPFGSERIEAGAFGNVSDSDIILNRQHDRTMPLARTGGGGLQVIDSPTELRLEAELPDTPTGREAMTLVRSGVLRGFSIEFRAIREYVRDKIVHVAQAALVGIALVDKPAYPASQVNRHAVADMEGTDCGNQLWKAMIMRGAI